MIHLMHKNIKCKKFRMKGIPIDIKDLMKKKILTFGKALDKQT